MLLLCESSYDTPTGDSRKVELRLVLEPGNRGDTHGACCREVSVVTRQEGGEEREAAMQMMQDEE